MESAVVFVYVNHRGEARERRVAPIKIWYGTTAWHPSPQWFLRGTDLERLSEAHASGEDRIALIHADRDFAMADITGWKKA